MVGWMDVHVLTLGTLLSSLSFHIFLLLRNLLAQCLDFFEPAGFPSVDFKRQYECALMQKLKGKPVVETEDCRHLQSVVQPNSKTDLLARKHLQLSPVSTHTHAPPFSLFLSSVVSGVTIPPQ